MKYLIFTAITFFSLQIMSAQHTGVPLGSPAYHIMDRLEIKTGISTPFHSSMKYYLRSDVTNYTMAIDTALIPLTIKDRRDLYYIFKDNNECLQSSNFATTLTGPNEPVLQKTYVDSAQTFYTIEASSQSTASQKSDRYILSKKPVFKHFYKTPANLWELNKPHFYLKVNPVLNFKLAKAKDDDQFIFYNQRGIDIRGGVDDRIFVQTNILESQARFPDYVTERIQKDRAIPGAGFFKGYESTIFDIINGYDFLLAQGYIGFNISKHVNMQFGHGRNFIGDGYRSMFLSDFGNNYFYLKTNVRVWRLHFQTLFMELNAQGSADQRGDVLIPKKYAAMHHLSFNITNNFNLGIFEAVVFNRNNNFELQYLNPVIFYRTIEQAVGSSDNAFIGLDFKWNLLKRFQVYGQLLLDEFKFDELIVERRGWWGNKYGIQLGLKYIDIFGIDHLDGQIEYNTARPYTYTHRDSSASYTHYNQPLAHPLGANFKEVVFKLRYQPAKKITLEPRIVFMNYGEDAADTNWGSNLLLPHTSREQDFNNETGQGIGTKTVIAALDVSYQFRHNLFLDLHYFYRKKNSDLDALDHTTNYFGGGIRWNFWNRNLDF